MLIKKINKNRSIPMWIIQKNKTKIKFNYKKRNWRKKKLKI